MVMPKLTNEMRDALRDESRHPVQVEDEVTQDRYVLVPWSIYQRISAIVGEGFSIEETYRAQEEALAAVWDDAELDAYNDYDAHHPPS
jgi:hypothetical protein